MKKYIVTLLMVALAVVGVAGATSTKNVHKACFYVDHRAGQTYADVSVNPKFEEGVCIVGRRGKNGKNGKAGATGAQGAAGAQGAQGAAGAAGADGSAGSIGATGAQGEQGEPGIAGPTGPAGANGATGPAGAIGVTGPAGPTGATGATGATGPAGADGQGANIGDVYACVSVGNNAKIVDTIAECDAGHDTIYRLDGVKVVTP
jgi:hypothetical protein